MKTHKPVCVAVFDYRPANTTVIYSTRGALLALDMPRHPYTRVCYGAELSRVSLLVQANVDGG